LTLSLNTAGRGGGSDEPEGEPLLDVGGSRVEMLQLQGEVEYNDAVIMDRQQGIEEIHDQILEVNEIFKVRFTALRRERACVSTVYPAWDVRSNFSWVEARTNNARVSANPSRRRGGESAAP